MSLGAGLASAKKSKHAGENSFGLVALCSIGPILSVMILSVIFRPDATTSVYEIPNVFTTADAFAQFTHALPEYAKEVAYAFVPIVLLFLIFQLITRRFHIHSILKMCVVFLYTYIGLVLFLAGANIGFMPAGRLIGTKIAGSSFSTLLVPIGMVYVMQVARKAGATGGTVIKGRLAEIEQFAEMGKTNLDGERELLCILAPLNTSKQIMEDVNKQFGLNADANGILFAIPVEKAYKI